jgi:hypothetical protein
VLKGFLYSKRNKAILRRRRKMCTKNILFFVVISALVLQSGFAYETRLWSMGDLRYIFQDEYNELNLFDFANMPAGFFADDTFSVFSFTAAGLKEK